MNRTIKSTSTVVKSEASFNDWSINFTETDSDKGYSISVYGRKGDNTVSANLSDNGSVSITFTNGVDKILMDEILNEIEDMKGVDNE